MGIVFALWIVWVLGSTRLRTPSLQEWGPREAELVRTTGSFLARVLQPDAGARRLLDHFFKRVRERASLQSEPGPPWDFLERHPRIAPADLEQLKKWYADANAARRVPLVGLRNLLVRLDRQLA